MNAAWKKLYIAFHPRGIPLSRAFFFPVVVVRTLGEKEDRTKLPFASAGVKMKPFPSLSLPVFSHSCLSYLPQDQVPRSIKKGIVCLEAGI